MKLIIEQALAACPVEVDLVGRSKGPLESYRVAHNHYWKVGYGTKCCPCYAYLSDQQAHSLMEKAWRERLSWTSLYVVWCSRPKAYCVKQDVGEGSVWRRDIPKSADYLEALAKAIVAVFGDHIADVGKKVEKDGA